MKKYCKRILLFSILLIVTFSLTMSLYTPAMASANAKDFVTVSRTESYTKDGLTYYCYNLANVTDKNRDYGAQDMIFSAKVVNSSGKTIFQWAPYTIQPGVSEKRNYKADYSRLPSGNYYTFILTAYTKNTYQSLDTSSPLGWTWSYKITHKSSCAISFKSIEKIRDPKGVMRQEFNIQCTNIKGKKLTFKIYDSNGNVVYSGTGPARQTDNEVGFLQWSGRANVGSNQKCKSGQYVVEVFYTGGTEVIQKTVNLII